MLPTHWHYMLLPYDGDATQGCTALDVLTAGVRQTSHARDCFFFSSRRRHTRCGRDWSSDVCSSDLLDRLLAGKLRQYKENSAPFANPEAWIFANPERSEERRVGKECRSRWSPYH